MRLLAVPLQALVLMAGVWVAGGVVTNDFRASMALTAAWFALSGAACVVVAVRRRALRIPVLTTYVVVVGAVGGFLALTTLRDRVVDERIVIGAPAPAAAATRTVPVAHNVELAAGRFRSGEHHTSGRAAVVRVPGGTRYLTLAAFGTSAGPDLRVRLVRGDTLDGGADGALDLGRLKGNRGDQQYGLPANVPVRGHSVVIWCRAFSASFGAAQLRGRASPG